MVTIYIIEILTGLVVFFCLAGIIGIVSGIVLYFNPDFDDDLDYRKLSKRILGIGIISVICCILTPTTQQAYRIFGIGGTIDYLNNNPDAKALPDKTIKILNKWADNVLEQDSIE